MVLLHLHRLCMRVLKGPTVCKEVTCIISEIYDHIVHNGLKTQQNCIKKINVKLCVIFHFFEDYLYILYLYYCCLNPSISLYVLLDKIKHNHNT